MARSRYKIFDNQYPYFVTGTIIQWLPLFSNPEVVQYLFNSLVFMQEHQRLRVYAFVIMENHLHLVVSSHNLSKELGDFKSFTARQIIDYYKRNDSNLILKKLADEKQVFKKDRVYQFWQEGSHPQEIQTKNMMIQKIEYIHNNPVRRGYVEEAVHWRYSSARNYLFGSGLIPVCKDW
ncbi:transposase [bacterium]|nr:transposase [bacterium]